MSELQPVAARRPPSSPSPAKRRSPGLVLRGSLYSLRLKVPKHLQGRLDRTHWCRALGTGRLSEAVRKARIVAAEFEMLLRSAEGQPIVISPVAISPTSMVVPEPQPAPPPPMSQGRSLTAATALYLADPSRRRGHQSAESYRRMAEMATEMFGEAITIELITRAHCRRFLEVLPFLPANYKRRLPGLSFHEAAALGRLQGARPGLNVATVNLYMMRLSAVLNFAVDEGYIARNPAKRLKLHDDRRQVDKRRPFSTRQLQAIVDAPLYRGCVNDRQGYAKPGPNHPRRTRFWAPLIALYSGLRLNEITQLDLTDIQELQGVPCFVVSRTTEGQSDKRIKSLSSERVVPVHPILRRLGFDAYVAEQRVRGNGKLFPDVFAPTTRGYYSDATSQWFDTFLRHCGAAEPKTSFHSFRHNFKDALREAGVDDEIALQLGGWSSRSGRDAAQASRGYGGAFSSGVLQDAIGKVGYPGVDLRHCIEGAGAADIADDAIVRR